MLKLKQINYGKLNNTRQSVNIQEMKTNIISFLRMKCIDAAKEVVRKKDLGAVLFTIDETLVLHVKQDVESQQCKFCYSRRA